MRFFRNISIGKKLTGLLVAENIAAILLAALCFFIYEWFHVRATSTQLVRNISVIVADQAAPLLQKGQIQAANTVLQSLSQVPYLKYAQIDSAQGEGLAQSGVLEINLTAIFSKTKKTVLFEGPNLVLRKSLETGGQTVGFLYLVYDFKPTRDRSMFYQSLVTLLILGFAIVLAIYLSLRFQGIISTPLLQLIGVARGITEKRDYTLRAPDGGKDEIGTFANAFNRMLDEVQSQDLALQKVPGELNKKLQDLEHEIAERKRIEEDLRSAELKYRALVEQLPVITYNAESTEAGKWFYVSPQIETILGYSQQEWVGDAKIWKDRLHADDRETFHAKANLMDRNGDQFICEYRIYDRYGRLHWFRDQSAIVRDTIKNVSYTHGFLLDITEQKQAEMELDTLQLQLLDISRQAGMAEVATGVLHNVGNVLNSVNVSANILSDLIKNSKLSSLSKVTTLLREHTNDLGKYITSDTKGKLLPTYLISLTEHLSEEHVDIFNELAILSKNVEHIKDIVSMQQSYAKVSGMQESVAPKDLVEDALQINAPSFSRTGLKVIRDIDETVPNVQAEKHKVLQILVNLFRNAKNAMESVPRKERKLTVGIHRKGRDWVKITVRDQGCGIAPENLTRIFSHGFTTKTDGHGFGLHIGALAAQEMGGSLIAESDGPGKGAVFILELPITNGKNVV